MKALFDDEALRADFPGGDDDDFVPGHGDTSAAGDELDPNDDDYIDVDEGEDEEIDEQEAIDRDNARDQAKETAGNEASTRDDEGLNENEELQAEGAPGSTEQDAEKDRLSSTATVDQPLKGE